MIIKIGKIQYAAVDTEQLELTPEIWETFGVPEGDVAQLAAAIVDCYDWWTESEIFFIEDDDE